MDEADLESLASGFGLRGPVKWTQLRAHRGKSVWRVDCRDGRFVVRILRPHEEDRAEHEKNMMTLARDAGLPVAKLVASSRLGARPALLLDWVPGRELTGEIHGRPWAAFQLGKLFAEHQARIHCSSLGDAPESDWIDCFGPVDEPVRARLEQIQSPPALLHLDYYPANLVYESGGISGILDWTNARLGDPRADLARTWALMKFVFRSGQRHPLRRLSDDLFVAGWRRGPRPVADRQDDMPVFLAWAVSGLLREKIGKELSDAGRREAIVLARVEQQLRQRAKLPPLPDLEFGRS